jgi:hypothetical protein
VCCNGETIRRRRSGAQGDVGPAAFPPSGAARERPRCDRSRAAATTPGRCWPEKRRRAARTGLHPDARRRHRQRQHYSRPGFDFRCSWYGASGCSSTTRTSHIAPPEGKDRLSPTRRQRCPRLRRGRYRLARQAAPASSGQSPPGRQRSLRRAPAAVVRRRRLSRLDGGSRRARCPARRGEPRRVVRSVRSRCWGPAGSAAGRGMAKRRRVGTATRGEPVPRLGVTSGPCRPRCRRARRLLDTP